MFFKTEVACEKTEHLLSALSEYQADLERGNYDTLGAYEPDWNAEEVWAAIVDNLRLVASKLPLSAEELIHFASQLKGEKFINFALVAQFFSSLYLLNTQKQVARASELTGLQNELHIQAGMPGLCLAYISAVEHSSLSLKSKLSALSQVLISLEKNKERFGTLSDFIIQISVQHWLRLFEQLDPELKTNFIRSKNNHQKRALNCLTVGEAQEKLTIIEIYTLKVLEKLNNGIGNINMDSEENSFKSSIK